MIKYVVLLLFSIFMVNASASQDYKLKKEKYKSYVEEGRESGELTEFEIKQIKESRTKLREAKKEYQKDGLTKEEREKLKKASREHIKRAQELRENEIRN